MTFPFEYAKKEDFDMLRRAKKSLEESVESYESRLSGKPSLKGTRFPISRIFAELGTGDYNLRQIAKEYRLNFKKLEGFLNALSYIYDNSLSGRIYNEMLDCCRIGESTVGKLRKKKGKIPEGLLRAMKTACEHFGK